MRCPKCGAADVYVVDSRDKGEYIRRRRKCERCGHRWYTREVDEALILEIVACAEKLGR